MNNEDRHIANRVILGFAVCVLSVVVLFILGLIFVSISPERSSFFSIRIVIAVVGLAVFVSDRIYMSKQNSRLR